MAFKLTDEQERIQEAFTANLGHEWKTINHVLGVAGAGSGKTTTMAQLAKSTKEYGVFFSFNTAIKDAAAKKMPVTVPCRTFHGQFYPIGAKYQHRSSKVSAKYTAELLGLTSDIELSERKMTPEQQARAVYQGVSKFSMSDDSQISGWHIPYLRGLTGPDMTVVRAELQSALENCWRQVVDINGQVRFRPENYIKIAVLAKTQISRKTKFVFVDEYQDTFPVIEGWLNRMAPWILRVCVGDDAQRINEWTGAVNSIGNARELENKEGRRLFTEYPLSKSFRFGPDLARHCNMWLAQLGDFRITGNENVNTIVSDEDDGIPYDAILCRTNAEVVRQAMYLVEDGTKVAISKRNQEEIKRVGEAAIQLMAGNSSDHEDFAIFNNWAEVQAYVKDDPGGQDIKVMVELIDKYGPGALLSLSDSLVHPDMAETMVITAHTAKGLEFDRVKIADDFQEPKPNPDGTEGEISPEEARLAYVAISRGKNFVNRGSLSYIDSYGVDLEDEDGYDE